MPTHIPRRSGVGARQVLPPRPPKQKRLRWKTAPADLCHALDPARPGIVDHETGEQLTDPVYCTARQQFDDGKPVPHRGKHRARLLSGIVVRWEDGQ